MAQIALLGMPPNYLLPLPSQSVFQWCAGGVHPEVPDKGQPPKHQWESPVYPLVAASWGRSGGANSRR